MNCKKIFRPLTLTLSLFLAVISVQAKEPVPAPGDRFVKPSITQELITLTPAKTFARYDLTVRGPGDFFYRESFDGSDIPFIATYDLIGVSLPEGTYVYEIIGVPVIAPEVREALSAARASGDREVVRALRAKGLIPHEGNRQTGSFTILNGSFIVPDHVMQLTGPIEAAEGRPDGSRPGSPEGDGDPGSTPDVDTGEDASRDILYIDDVIVDSSLCVGTSCVNGEVFGSDTIRMKEANLRIKFQDTSVSPYPTNDWQLTANDSSPGGANKFSIDDIDNSRTPFTIEAGARTNALYVDSSGNIGLGTANPVAEMHVISGNTPALRLQQDASGGFSAQTWELGGNEAGFFVKDATAGEQLPFRIKPGAASSSLVVDSDNDVGIGILSPEERLHIRQADGPVKFLIDGEAPTIQAERTADDVDNTIILLDLINNGQVNLRYNNNKDGTNRRWNTGVDNDDQYFISRGGTGAIEFTLDSSGDLTTTGTVNGVSDVNMKKDFEPISPEEVLNKVVNLPITSWQFKNDIDGARHIGPMAQDFYAAFGLGDDERHIAYSDTAGVALSAIQGLTRYVKTLEEKIAVQEARIRELEKEQGK